jgi:hypothetical protein
MRERKFKKLTSKDKEYKDPVTNGYMQEYLEVTLEETLDKKDYVTKNYLDEVLDKKDYVTKTYLSEYLDSKGYVTKDYLDTQIENNLKRHIDAVFEQFKDYFKVSFESIEMRLERMGFTLDEHDAKLNNHNKRITALELRNTR